MLQGEWGAATGTEGSPMTGWRAGVLAALVLFTPAARGVDAEAVDKAVQRGVAFLRGGHQADGRQGQERVGATALATLALLECDVAPGDAVVRQSADAVRTASLQLTHTYSVALSLMLLDRLGDSGDVPLIESLAVRLLAGQNAQG